MDLVLKKTKNAFLWTWILRAPFWVVYNLLLFILYKDLKATPFQIALFIALKPAVSIFSMYWSSYLGKRPDKILSNVIWGGVIAYAPFLCLPFFGGAWFLLFAASIFIMMHRGIVPGWMEILKLNLGETKQKTFAFGAIVSHAIGCILPFLIGPIMDQYPGSWRLFFFFFGLLGFITFIFQLKIPVEQKEAMIPSSPPLKERVLHPWKKTFEILKESKDFRMYQIGFMVLGGAGLMIMQPVLPQFFVDVLGLSYTELSIALTLCKGLGFALFSPLWAKMMPKTNIYNFSSLVTLLAALFPLILFAAKWNLIWVYVAYVIYGILQGGSELSWHFSGPIFAKEKDSSPYSTVNILTVGLRGILIPQIGSFLALFMFTPALLFLGSLLCISGAFCLALLKLRGIVRG